LAQTTVRADGAASRRLLTCTQMGDDEFWAWQARTIHAYPLSVH